MWPHPPLEEVPGIIQVGNLSKLLKEAFSAMYSTSHPNKKVYALLGYHAQADLFIIA